MIQYLKSDLLYIGSWYSFCLKATFTAKNKCKLSTNEPVYYCKTEFRHSGHDLVNTSFESYLKCKQLLNNMNFY